jgi:YggT family protein
MEATMRQIMSVLSTLTSLYILVITARIIMTWFSGNIRVPEILSRITDPYLNWFRGLGLRVGYLDLSPVVGVAVLSILNQVFTTMARFGAITLGIILAMILQALWSILSFFIILISIVLILRLIAYLCNLNIYGTFWRIVDTVSQPILYRINRLFFRGRIINFLAGLILSAAVMAVLYLVCRFIIILLSGFLIGLPV